MEASGTRLFETMLESERRFLEVVHLTNAALLLHLALEKILVQAVLYALVRAARRKFFQMRLKLFRRFLVFLREQFNAFIERDLQFREGDFLVERSVLRRLQGIPEVLLLVQVAAQIHHVLPKLAPVRAEMIETRFFQSFAAPHHLRDGKPAFLLLLFHCSLQFGKFFLRLFVKSCKLLIAQRVGNLFRTLKDFPRLTFLLCIQTKLAPHDGVEPFVVERAKLFLLAHNIVVADDGDRIGRSLGEALQDFSEHIVAAHLGVHLLRFQAQMADTRRNPMLFQNVVLNACEILAQIEEIICTLGIVPLRRFLAAAFLRLLRVRPLEENFRRTFLASFHIVDLARGKHQVHMRMPFTCRHRADFLVNRPSVIVVLQMLFDEAVEDFLALFHGQLVWQREDDLLIAFAVCTLEAIGSMKEPQRRIFSPLRQMVSRHRAAAALLVSGFAIDVLQMRKGEVARLVFLQDLQDGIGGFRYGLLSFWRKGPSQSETGIPSSSLVE